MSYNLYAITKMPENVNEKSRGASTSRIDRTKFYRDIETALQAGIDIIQLREKITENNTFDDILEVAKQTKQLCDKYGVKLIINDHLEICKEVGAAGVHLGSEDESYERARQILGKEKIIGITAKTVASAVYAQRLGADYIGSGDMFGSRSKQGTKIMSRAYLKEITDAVNIPVVAIGGITRDNILELKGTGISGVAIIGGIFNGDIKANIAALRNLITEIIE